MRAALASVILLMLLNLSIVSATTTVTFQPGAYIIDMSTAPPALNYANGLKPYGLVYDLIINKQIPVSWAINPTKSNVTTDTLVDTADRIARTTTHPAIEAIASPRSPTSPKRTR